MYERIPEGRLDLPYNWMYELNASLYTYDDRMDMLAKRDEQEYGSRNGNIVYQDILAMGVSMDEIIELEHRTSADLLRDSRELHRVEPEHFLPGGFYSE